MRVSLSTGNDIWNVDLSSAKSTNSKMYYCTNCIYGFKEKNTECILYGRDGEIDHEENVGKYGQMYSTILSKN